ncbi:RNA polymerase sigma factor [Flavipsychrobacter stenotrophus]|uniref:RNA polymerase sigma factor n=1 Tax=Flavipsychrobacter stenotrophus TaxID=2077091 RepID=UPI001F0C9E24|nr:RNA polymerase sigma factor [Flavipsychrobacter stenotrophus]
MAPIAVTYSEEELILLLKQQSRDAFNYLYKNYSAVLFGVINKVVFDEETASDVLQEAFVKIWNNIDRYDSKKGRIYTWMINIARNAAIDKLRSKGEIMKSKIQTGEDIVNDVTKGQKTEQSTDTIGLRKMVSELRPEYEVIVSMAYFKGFTLDEISKTLNIPLGTVKTRMRSAMQQLRNEFNN